jgi:glutathione S-transferase
MGELYYLHVSPWSEKARWAMDLSHYNYTKINFTPMITTPIVRIRSRNFTHRVTAPTLISNQLCINDAYSIARYVNNENSGKHNASVDLFPCDLNNQIDELDNLSNQILQAGRALVCIRMKNNRGAKLMSLPPVIPPVIRPIMLPVATMGLYYFKAKYGFDWNKHEEYIETMRLGLRKVQEQLTNSGDYLLGKFTYADIALAVTLQMIEPIGKKYIPLDSDTESCWKTPELKEEFSDLIEWRNHIYQKHRSA